MAERIPNRIRDIRRARGLTLEEIAARLGEDVSASTVSRLENGRIKLTHAWLEKVGAALGVNPLELIADEASQIRLIPIIGLVAAGNWAEAIEDPHGWMPIPGDIGGPRTFALEIKGDSMNQLVDDAETIAIDPDQIELIPGKPYVITNSEGEATFKRYMADPPRLEPHSSNPEHQPIQIGREPFLIVGRAVYISRQL